MAFTTKVRFWWEMYRCSPGVLRAEGFFGRHPVREQLVAHDAVTTLELGHYNTGYVPNPDGLIGSIRRCPKGIAGAVCQPSGSGCSIHNYVAAYDIEYNYNRYIRASITPEDFDEWWFPAVCKYTLAQVRTIEGIKNIFGEQIWRWFGWSIGDFMHWQINVPPERCEVDWNTVPGMGVEGDMNARKILDRLGVAGLTTLGRRGAFLGAANWYFGESQPADDENLVEVLLAWSLLNGGTSSTVPQVKMVSVVRSIG